MGTLPTEVNFEDKDKVFPLPCSFFCCLAPFSRDGFRSLPVASGILGLFQRWRPSFVKEAPLDFSQEPTSSCLDSCAGFHVSGSLAYCF